MKKIIFSFIAGISLFLTGCLETTQEITLNADGSGTIMNKSDMSQLIAAAKQMGGAEEIGKAGEQKIDSTVSMKEGADSIPNLTPEEREMARKGVLNILFDLEAENCYTKMTFPFASASEIGAYTKLSNKILAETLKGQMGDGGPMGEGGMPEASSFDDYYTIEYTNGSLSKKLDKEKYAGAESDPYLKGVREAGAMGLAMKANYVINLPRPATSLEGKGAKLSEDKKQVMISANVDDFFDDPSMFEFSVKY